MPKRLLAKVIGHRTEAALSPRNGGHPLASTGPQVRRDEHVRGTLLESTRLEGVGPVGLSSCTYYVQGPPAGRAGDFEVTGRRYVTLPKAQRRLAKGVVRLARFRAHAEEREMRFKAPAQPLSAMEKEAWKRERMAQFQG